MVGGRAVRPEIPGAELGMLDFKEFTSGSLQSLTVVVPDAAGLAGAYSDIIRDELNLKSVDLQDAAEGSAAGWAPERSRSWRRRG